MRQEETFRRLSQSIVDAAKPSTEDEAREAQKAASLVVNSVGSMIQPKRTERPTAFSEATDFLGNAIKAAREAKLAQARDKKETDSEKPAKTLAQLLVKAQDSE
jgi:hypothetical protein